MLLSGNLSVAGKCALKRAGAVVAYAHGATAVANAYYGGVFDPINNRIYFAPYAQASQANWHYRRC